MDECPRHGSFNVLCAGCEDEDARERVLRFPLEQGTLSSSLAERPEEAPPRVKTGSGKLRYGLVDPRAHAEVVAALTAGAVIYGDFAWKTHPRSETEYIEAALRHIEEFRDGKGSTGLDPSLDPEDKLHRLAKAIASLHFVLANELECVALKPSGPLSERLAFALAAAEKRRKIQG